MSRFDGNIVVGTSVDVGGINTGLNKITSSFSRLAKHVSNSALVNLFTKAASAASDLVEVQNVVDVSFESMAWKAERFADNAIKQFGMSELAAKQTAGSFMAMGKAADLGSENASNMAINLAALTGDFASFYNISQEYARVALSAVYTGETETLKRYGIILTEANLQAYATTKGIEKQVKAMNAREKLILRYMYVMDKTEDIQGDFVRTQDSFANQTRLLSQSWTQFLQVLGNGVTTVMAPVLKVMGQMLVKLRQFTMLVLSIIGNIFGIDFSMPSSEMEGYADAIDDAAEAEDDLADATGRAGKAAWKAIQPFDELNVIRTPSSGGGKAGGADIFADWDADLLYNWQEEIDEIFESTIDNFYDFGRWLSTGFADILDKIPWDAIFGVARRFGKNLSDFLNGLLDPNTFTKIGTTLANGLNTIIYALQEFAHNFDWEQAGEAIANFINALFGTFDYDATSDTINTLANGLVTMFKTAISIIKWEEIANKIKKFLSDIDWKVKLAAVGTVLTGGLLFMWKSVIWPFIRYWLRRGLSLLFSKVIGPAIADGLMSLTGTTSVASAILTFAGQIVGAIAAAIGGYLAGKNIFGPLLMPEDKDVYKDFSIFKFITTLADTDLSTLGKALHDMLTDLNGIGFMISPLAGSLMRLFDAIKEGDVVGTFAAAIDSVINVSPLGAMLETLELIINTISKFTGSDKTFADFKFEIADTIITKILEVKEFIIGFFEFLGEEFVNKFNEIRDSISTKIDEWKTAISTKFEEIKTLVTEKLQPIVDAITVVAEFVGHLFYGVYIIIKGIILTIAEYAMLKAAEILAKIILVKDAIVYGVNLILSTVLDCITFIWEKYQEFNDWLFQYTEGIFDFIAGIINSILDKVNEFKDKAKEKLEEFKTRVDEIFTNIRNRVSNTFSAIYTDLNIKFITPAKNKFTEWFSWIKVNIVEPIKTVFSDMFRFIGEEFKNQVENIENRTKLLANVIISIFENMINGIIKNGLNLFLGLFNKVAKAAADKTGDTWIDIPDVSTISIPKLARGAVIPPNAPFLAMLGDQRNGTNIEAPLDTIKQAVAEVLASNGFGANGDINIQCILDGREIARAVVKQNEIYKKSTGRNLI